MFMLRTMQPVHAISPKHQSLASILPLQPRLVAASPSTRRTAGFPTPQTLAAFVPQHKTLHRFSCRRWLSTLACCSTSKPHGGGGEGDDNEKNSKLYTLGMAALWIGLSVYGFLLSPNQTPYRDQVFIKLLVGIREPGEEYVVNQVYTALFNIMGIWPAVYASLLIPAGRSENKLPAWPFVSASFAFGVFALLPYFTFWRPIKDQKLPPAKEELEGWNKLFIKGAETPVLPALLIAGSSAMLYLAATAGGASWLEFGRLLDESRLVHVTTLDFMCLTAFAPFWMLNDAEKRGWEQRNTLLPILSLLPALGPAIYLLLRPKTDMSQ